MRQFGNTTRWFTEMVCGKKVGYQDTPDVAKKAAEVVRKKSNNWLMVELYNGSEITTSMGYSCTTKSAKSNAAFLR